MNQTNKEAMWEFLRGAGLTVLVLLLFLGFLSALGEFDPKPAERFRVIDTYSNCAIVEYTPPNRAQSVMFLDCGNAHLSERE